MRRETPLKLLAGADVIVGLCWIVALLIVPLCAKLASGEFEVGWQALFAVALVIWLCLPAGFVLWAGWRLWKQTDRSTIKYGVGTLLTCLGLFAVFQLYHWTGAFGNMLDLLAALCIGLPVYVILSKALMRRMGIPVVRGEFFGRGILQLAAFLLCLSLSDTLRILQPRFGEPVEMVDSLAFFGTILVPFLLYRLSVRCWVRDPHEEIARLDFQPSGGVTDAPVK